GERHRSRSPNALPSFVGKRGSPWRCPRSFWHDRQGGQYCRPSRPLPAAAILHAYPSEIHRESPSRDGQLQYEASVSACIDPLLRGFGLNIRCPCCGLPPQSDHVATARGRSKGLFGTRACLFAVGRRAPIAEECWKQVRRPNSTRRRLRWLESQ